MAQAGAQAQAGSGGGGVPTGTSCPAPSFKCMGFIYDQCCASGQQSCVSGSYVKTVAGRYAPGFNGKPSIINGCPAGECYC